jgi:hypothetical protein
LGDAFLMLVVGVKEQDKKQEEAKKLAKNESFVLMRFGSTISSLLSSVLSPIYSVSVPRARKQGNDN